MADADQGAASTSGGGFLGSLYSWGAATVNYASQSISRQARGAFGPCFWTYLCHAKGLSSLLRLAGLPASSRHSSTAAGVTSSSPLLYMTLSWSCHLQMAGCHVVTVPPKKQMAGSKMSSTAFQAPDLALVCNCLASFLSPLQHDGL